MVLHTWRSFLLLTVALAFTSVRAQHWMRGWGSLADDRIEAMEPLPGGDVIAVGSFSAFFNMQGTGLVTQGVTDAFVARVNATGDVVWAQSIGGAGVDRALDVAVDANGNVAIVGQFAGTMQVGSTTLVSNAGSLDGFVVHCDANGNFQWAASMGSSANADRASAVALAPDGSVLVGGDFSHTALFGSASLTSAFDNLLNAPGIDVFLARFSNAGVFQWVRQGSATLEEECVSVACDNTGAAYIAGRFTDDITFQQLHPNAQDDAIFLVKFDGLGNEVWFSRLAGAVTNQSADLEWKGGALYLAGHQTGNTIHFGNTNTPVGSTYANSAFILKMDATGAVQDQWSFGSENLVGAVDISIGDTAIVIGGWFECFLSQGGDENGAGLFMSIGERNNWVAEVGLASLQHGFVQQFGSHFPGGMNAIALGDDEVIKAAGVYRGDLVVASIDTLFDALPELLVAGANLDATICNDTAYGDFIGLDSIALFDAFIMAALPRERSIYDVFARTDGTCDLSTMPWGSVGPVPGTTMIADTGFACGTSAFAAAFPFTPLVAPFLGGNGPWVHGIWHDGLTGFGNSADTLQQLWFEGSTDNGCYTFSDSIWGSSWPAPSLPAITDDQGVNTECTSCLDIIVCLPTLPLLTATLPDSIVSFEWILPNNSTSSDTMITTPISGYYNLTVYNSFGCAATVQVEVILQPVGSLDSLTALFEFSFPDDTDGNDTLVLCGSGSVDGIVVHSIFDNGVLVTSDPAGITALDSVFTGSGIFLSTTTLPISVNPGFVVATIIGEGWYVWEYHYYLSNFPCDSDLFLFVARDSIYVDTILTSFANVYITGPILMCAGDTVELAAVTSDPGALAWTGAGIVGDTTATIVQVTQPGYYALELVPLDTGDCVYGYADTHLIELDPAPFITMLPANGLICPDDSIMIMSSLSGNNQWYGPTGPIGTNDSILYVSGPGTYFVVFTGPAGCGQASNTVEVVNYSTPYIDAFPQPVLCNGGSVTLNVNAPGDLVVVQWLPPLSGNGLSQTVSQPGTYQCSVTVCGIVTIAEIEVIASSVSVGIVDPGPFTICNDSTTVLSATSGLTAYLWIPTLATGETVFVGPGQHSVIGFDQYGCTDTAGVVVVYAFAFTDSVQGSATSVCAGDSSVASAIGSGMIQWFSDAAGTQPIGNGASITYGPLFNSTTIHVFQTENGCTSDAVAIPIVVNQLPQPVGVLGDTIACAGGYMYFYLPFENFTPIEWSGPTGSLPDGAVTIPNAYDSDAGWYTYTYQASNGCWSTMDSVLVTVFPNPDPGLPPDTLICIGDLLTISATPGLANYLWSTGALTASITITEPGTYGVIVTGTGGCQAADSIVVGAGACDLEVPNVITPNGDGTNDVIDIDLSGFATATMMIWNRWGQKLDEITAPRIVWDGRDRLSGEPVPSGTYFWTLSATRASGLVQEASGYLMVLYER